MPAGVFKAKQTVSLTMSYTELLKLTVLKFMPLSSKSTKSTTKTENVYDSFTFVDVIEIVL